jgi:outer membrane protein OmpA-like peptidoglycan-associated protein
MDGIPDDADDCPQVAGVATFNGCPDTDADGLPDADDKCPSLAGTLASKGCPEVSDALKALLAKITQGVQFETGSDRLTAQSMAVVDTLVHVLAAHPHYHLYIAGHTDNQGKAASNLRLSKARALACYNHLIEKGVAADVMSHQGFGHTRPVVPNTTTAGRKQNRRVAFELRVE